MKLPLHILHLEDDPNDVELAQSILAKEGVDCDVVLVEDRYDRRSTLVAAQLPIQHWHEALGDPTLADAILDRLIHNAHKIALKGESMRKKRRVAQKAS